MQLMQQYLIHLWVVPEAKASGYSFNYFAHNFDSRTIQYLLGQP
ncbi:hypothetical protein C8D97_10348 [Pleionea mediterranea]|uniref:Uncharacterized protein n=1 Tax=Pleionea mediterranea TaxID=523701 RepID=A0A316FYL9_9GAMM|nr:hypothetical protein C8D97_10348 [Pleionea mediterranea]